MDKKSSKIKKSGKMGKALMAAVMASTTTVGVNALPLYAEGLDKTTSSQEIVEVLEGTINKNAKNIVNVAAESEIQATIDGTDVLGGRIASMVPVTYDESKGNPILKVDGNINYVSIDYYGDVTGGTIKYTNQIRSGFDNIPVVGNRNNETPEGNYKIAIKLKNLPSVTTWIKITKVATDTTAPVITVMDQTLKLGEQFNPRNGLSAIDDVDGDITDKVEIIDANNVNVYVPGTYEVTYKVSDSAGNVTEKKVTVKVEVDIQATIDGADVLGGRIASMVPVTYDESKGNPILKVDGNINYVSIDYYGDAT